MAVILIKEDDLSTAGAEGYIPGGLLIITSRLPKKMQKKPVKEIAREIAKKWDAGELDLGAPAFYPLENESYGCKVTQELDLKNKKIIIKKDYNENYKETTAVTFDNYFGFSELNLDED